MRRCGPRGVSPGAHGHNNRFLWRARQRRVKVALQRGQAAAAGGGGHAHAHAPPRGARGCSPPVKTRDARGLRDER
jgi:hypothetical protein